MAVLLQTLRRTRVSLPVPGAALQGVVRTERQPWETAGPALVDPAPPGLILQLVWERLPEGDDRESAELPDVDSAPLDPVPATVRVVCVLDRAVLADAHVRRLHVAAFGKDSLPPGATGVAAGGLPHPPTPPPPGESRGMGGGPGASTACHGNANDGGRTSSRHRGALAPTC